MNRRVLIIVSCALVLSACASYLVYRAVGSRVTAGKRRRVSNLSRRRDLPAGTLIRDSDLKTAAWFGHRPPARFFTRCPPEPAVASSIYAGELVTENRLAP